MSLAVIGIGSNILPEKNLARAAEALRTLWPQIRCSPVYQTAPQDRTDQPSFLNAIGIVETETEPINIYDALQTIERTLQKDVRERFGPRTIDLDLLLYGTIIFPDQREWAKAQSSTHHTGLLLPHPRMHRRRFVLEPLCALGLGDLTHPVLQTTFHQLLHDVTDQPCTIYDLDL